MKKPALSSPSDEHRIPKLTRTLLISLAAVSWLAGGVATFVGSNQGGSVALIVGGVAAGLLGILGRWPSRVAISGHEVQWGAVRTAITEQIGAIDYAEDDAGRAAEFALLLDRLRVLESTGSLPEHPAVNYDREVVAALKRTRSGATIMSPLSRSRSTADFAMLVPGGTINIETKWIPDPDHTYSGSTLSQLISSLSERSSLLIITNAINSNSAREKIKSHLGDRGDVITWTSRNDDESLKRVLDELAGQSRMAVNPGTPMVEP